MPNIWCDICKYIRNDVDLNIFGINEVVKQMPYT